jgi:peptidase E
MAGGNFRNPAAMTGRMTTILTETGKEHPGVAYIGTASGDDASFFSYAADMIRQAGAGSVTLVKLAGKNADPRKAAALLDAADAIFISGGDVEEGMRWLNQHRMVPCIRQAFGRGAVLFGISAGSIMLGTHWVRWGNPDDDASAELFDCIGIAPLICDTHAEKDGWEELKTTVALRGAGGRGYGIPSGGTLRINPGGTVAALDKPAVCYESTAGGIHKRSTLKAGI